MPITHCCTQPQERDHGREHREEDRFFFFFFFFFFFLAERASDLTERAAGLSDEVLESVESGQRTAIDAVRKFVGAVDESMPAHGDDHPSRRRPSSTPPWRWRTSSSRHGTTHTKRHWQRERDAK